MWLAGSWERGGVTYSIPTETHETGAEVNWRSEWHADHWCWRCCLPSEWLSVVRSCRLSVSTAAQNNQDSGLGSGSGLDWGRILQDCRLPAQRSPCNQLAAQQLWFFLLSVSLSVIFFIEATWGGLSLSSHHRFSPPCWFHSFYSVSFLLLKVFSFLFFVCLLITSSAPGEDLETKQLKEKVNQTETQKQDKNVYFVSTLLPLPQLLANHNQPGLTC